MADFRPESTIVIFSGTGVDRENQPYFTSEAAKMAWYNSFQHVTYDQYSYQREQRQFVRVFGRADRLKTYDMLAFQNSAASKWILCNITGVEWVNPNTCDIFFETDYMQTYIENIVFDKCWVEREMVDNDWAGGRPSWQWLQPEGLDPGPLKRELADTYDLDSYDIVVYSLYDQNGEPNYTVTAYDHYPNGLNEIVFPMVNGPIAGLNAMLQAYADKGIDVATAIAGVYVIPSVFNQRGSGVKSLKPINWTQIDGYTVVNAKCFTSEFFNVEVSNRQGATIMLKPESLPTVAQFGWKAASCAGNGGIAMWPLQYEGNVKDYAVMLPCNVQGQFVSNAFASWQANKGLTNAVGMISSFVGGIGRGAAQGASIGGNFGVQGAAIGALAGASMGAIQGSIGSASFAERQSMEHNPARSGGSSGGAPLQIAIDNLGFTFNFVHPYASQIQSIDEYFSRFGYKVNRFKEPNVNTRPKWNFVKTIGASVHGPMTGSANAAICAALDNGVTFWHVGGGTHIGEFGNMMENRG